MKVDLYVPYYVKFFNQCFINTVTGFKSVHVNPLASVHQIRKRLRHLKKIISSTQAASSSLYPHKLTTSILTFIEIRQNKTNYLTFFPSPLIALSFLLLFRSAYKHSCCPHPRAGRFPPVGGCPHLLHSHQNIRRFLQGRDSDFIVRQGHFIPPAFSVLSSQSLMR
jgi:hypothetical protein